MLLLFKADSLNFNLSNRYAPFQLSKLEFEEVIKILNIRYVLQEDKDFWYSLDKHLPVTTGNNPWEW